MGDALHMVTRKSRWKLVLLVRTECTKNNQTKNINTSHIPPLSLDGHGTDDEEDADLPPLIGFIIYRLRPELQALAVAKIAIVPEHRGKGHGGRLVDWVK